jgi:serine acetyltransferase
MIASLLRKVVARWRRAKDPAGYLRGLGMRVGRGCRFYKPHTIAVGSEPFLIRLGDRVTVADGVHFITHDGGVWVFRERHPHIDVFAPIAVGNNVFIGPNTMIMPGVTIGDNVVIGAGSVVTKDIPSDSVAAGVPARVIKSLDAYYQGVIARAMHIPPGSIEERRRVLLEKYGEKTANGAAR